MRDSFLTLEGFMSVKKEVARKNPEVLNSNWKNSYELTG